MTTDAAMLKGKCSLVTGATSGLGQAIATHLARQGCNIVLSGFGDTEVIEADRRSLESESGVGVLYHPADLAKPAEIAAMIEAAARAFGSVDILVNNAVVRHFAPIDDFPSERWDAALAVNLSAAFHTIRLCLPGMRARNWGRIVNMASGFSFFAEPNRVDYITTKTALLGLTRAVAVETAKLDITCNAVCPATIATPAIEGRIDELAAREELARDDAVARYLSTRQPSGRFIESLNVARLIVFLCGPGGRDITGAALPIDGGWTAS